MGETASHTGDARHLHVVTCCSHCAPPAVLLHDFRSIVFPPVRRCAGNGIRGGVCWNMRVGNGVRLLLALLGEFFVVFFGLLTAPSDV